MTIQERFEALGKSGAEVPRPLELYGKFDENAAASHLDAKAAAFGPGAIPPKYKALAAVSAAVALDSTSCIVNNVKLARSSGAGLPEVMEAIAIGRYAKGATTVSSAALALEWLATQE